MVVRNFASLARFLLILFTDTAGDIGAGFASSQAGSGKASIDSLPREFENLSLEPSGLFY